jgi:hypothetical protein
MSTVMTMGTITMMTRVDESPVYLNIVIHIMQSHIGTQLLDMPPASVSCHPLQFTDPSGDRLRYLRPSPIDFFFSLGGKGRP